jgi:hypothetical protein
MTRNFFIRKNLNVKEMKMMKKEKLLMFVVTVAITLTLLAGSAFALPTLLTDEITKFKYTNFEVLFDNNSNGIVDAGDDFYGILNVTSIHNVDDTATTWTAGSGNDELTGIFKLSVADGQIPLGGGGHIDFVLDSDDYFKMFYQASGENWSPGTYAGGDPTLSAAWANASDGDLYIEINPSVFYEGINDTAVGIASVNRNWGDLAANGTGYTIIPQLWPEIIDLTAGPFIHSDTIDLIPGNDPELPFTVGGHISDIFIENHLFNHSGSGAWQFRSEDPAYIWATRVPEPGTIFLLGAGLLGLGYYRRKR